MSTKLLHRAVAVMAALIAIPGSTAISAPDSGYVPGLGEFMAAMQMHHAKLWFAGEAGNWPLAAYELDEVEEGFGDIVKFHPVHEGSPVPIKEILPELTAAPVDRLRAAIGSRDGARFEAAFDALTAACNACHREENFYFNVIKRPGTNPYTNQDFSPSPPPADERARRGKMNPAPGATSH